MSEVILNASYTISATALLSVLVLGLDYVHQVACSRLDRRLCPQR